jgi:hypothetical protein
VSATPVTQGEWAHVPMSFVQPDEVHTPLLHVPAQMTPQPPQLLSSLPIVSTQLLLQHVSELHGMLQPPQLFWSLVVSTHWLSQHVLSTPRHEPPQLPPVSGCT